MVYETSELKELARQLRRDTVRMIGHTGSGHPGGALGAAEVFAVLYGTVMRHSVSHLADADRDRLVISNGHICAAWYSVLARFGYLPLEELATLRQLGSRLQGHPARSKLPELVETSSGPLGQGLPVAKGIAQANRLRESSGRVYCIVGDGEMHEGIIWEALMTAGQHRVSNLTLIVMYNGLQIDGAVSEIKDIQPLADKLAAFRWHVAEVDGHNVEELVKAFNTAKEQDQSTAIIANTVMGKGVPFMENLAKWHGSTPSEEEVERALEAIGVAKGYSDFPIAQEVSA